MSITYKDPDGVQGMRVAGRLASEVLDYLTPHIKPGIQRLPTAKWPVLPSKSSHLGVSGQGPRWVRNRPLPV